MSADVTPDEPTEPSRGISWRTALPPLLVLAVALALAGGLYGHFRADSRSLWDGPAHDRNSHYLFSLRLATAVRQGHVLRLLEDLNRAAVWPPLHGVLAAGVLLVGGLDYRLAVLPSLAGWVATVAFGFLTARRAVRSGGNLAGIVAALFILASPAHRAFATDVMLESLGAGITLAVLYAYLVVVQDGPGRPWAVRCLGLALTALFWHKYNYWLLVLLALAAAELTRQPGVYWQALGEPLRRLDWRRWLMAQLRHPLTYVLVVVVLLTAAVFAHGDRPFVVAGRSVSLYPPYNLLHGVYVVVFLRLALWWRAGGGDWVKGLDDRIGQLVRWHAMPVSFWLVLPKHASMFLWFLSPANAEPGRRADVWEGLREYATWATADYHAAAWTAVLAVALIAVALLSWRRLNPGGTAILWLLFLGAALAVSHPNRKERFLHSWLAAEWVAAGIGLSALVYGRLTALLPRVRPWLATAAAVGLGAALLPNLTLAGHAPEGGLHPQQPCWLDLVDFYRADLEQARRATVLAALPVKPMAQWTILERDGRLDRLEENWYGFAGNGCDNRDGFRHWLDTTECDTLVFFDHLYPGPSPWDVFPDCHAHAQLRDLLRGQNEFRLVKDQTFLPHGCRVQVWKRVRGAAQAGQPAPR